MSIWWLIPAFVGLVGVLMLVGGVAKLFKAQLWRRHDARAVRRADAGGRDDRRPDRPQPADLCAALQGAAGGAGGAEEASAISTTSPRSTLRMPRASCAMQPKAYQITGQRIHIEGPVVKFKPWANVIGMDSPVQGERGRTAPM